MSQQQKKIFIDCSLWNHRWFDDMPLKYQMAYMILWAESNNIGIWKPHFRQLNYKLKLNSPEKKVQPTDLLEHLNRDKKQVEIVDNDRWWLISYLPMQVKTLTPTNRPHVSYIEILRDHDLLIKYCMANPQNVNFDVISELKEWNNIEEKGDRKRAQNKFQYLKTRGLARPLEEACEALDGPFQESKDKEQDKEKDPVREESENPYKNGEIEKEKNEIKDQKQLSNGLSDLSYYRKLGDEIGDLARFSVGDLTFYDDVDEILQLISSSGIQNPKCYLLEYVKKVDWNNTSWNEMVSKIKSDNEIPF